MTASTDTNTIYTDLVSHFGKALANRVYACAMIMADGHEDLTDENGEPDMAKAVRYTIGAVKRMLRQATKKVTWLDAVERLEAEQVEARHYGMATVFSQDIARIEAYNQLDEADQKASGYTRAGMALVGKAHKAERKASAVSKIMLALEAESTKYDDDTETQTQVKEWVAEYIGVCSRTKLAFISRIVKAYKEQEEITEADRKHISRRYAPRGVKPLEFVELLARYA